jgi:ArsR family transcriptional regulator
LDQPVLIPAVTDAKSSDAAVLLPAVADPLRWRIVRLLAREPLCTCHLQEELGARQTLVSHHLRVLREAGIVAGEPCGRFTYYRLVPGALDGLAAAIGALAASARADVPRRPC